MGCIEISEIALPDTNYREINRNMGCIEIVFTLSLFTIPF